MATNRRNLEILSVTSPCQQDWNEMRGTDTSRFCAVCRQSVYNLSAMSRSEAEQLISEKANICVRFYRRHDGTVVTQDCSRIRKAIQRGKRCAAAVASLILAAIIAPIVGTARAQETSEHVMGRICQTQPTTEPGVTELMGDVAMGGVAPPTTQPAMGLIGPLNPPTSRPTGG